MPLSEFIIRLCVATGAGVLIGFERQLHRKKAGLRTHTLVAMGAAIFTLLSFQITAQQGGDATRVVGQVVTGIGFLGAGVIIHQGLSVQGLTTAATIWCSAAVGCLAATGFYVETSMSTLMVMIVNLGLKKLDNWLDARSK